MATEGLKKRDIQRNVQKVHLGSSVSSDVLSAAGTVRIELGFPAEKLTIVTTGNLAANVTPKLGAANSNTAIAATTTISTTTTSHMFCAVEIAWTSGSGQVLILAK